MKLDNIVRCLRVLGRADAIILDIYLRTLLARSGLFIFAGLIAGFGLLMLGIGLYFALSELWGPIRAALAVGAGSVGLALLLVLVATRVKPGRDLQLAREIHSTALDTLVGELRGIEAEVRGLTSMARWPLSSAVSGLLIPILGMILKRVRGTTRS